MALLQLESLSFLLPYAQTEVESSRAAMMARIENLIVCRQLLLSQPKLTPKLIERSVMIEVGSSEK